MSPARRTSTSARSIASSSTRDPGAQSPSTATACAFRPLNPSDPQAVGALLEAWYRRQAQTVFAELLAAAGPRVHPLGIVPPAAIRIRRMKTRWGSCTTRGDITLNLRLIQADRGVIEYVLVHELCHLAA